MLIAQISDLHIQLRGKDSQLIQAEQHLAACVHALNQLDPRPELVVITGDLTEHGSKDEYETLRTLLERLQIRYLLIPGNHDSPAMLREVFKGHAYLQNPSPFIQYAIDEFPLRIVGLDTTVPLRGHGRLCAERLAWLAATLARAPQVPTVVLMHHPPFETGIARMDELGLLEGRDEFIELVGAYPNIERILCGHLHRSIVCRVAGTIASTCPGTAHQIELDLRAAPGELQFNFEPPGYQLHRHGPQGLVTHHAVIGSFPGPYPF